MKALGYIAAITLLVTSIIILMTIFSGDDQWLWDMFK